MKRSVVVPFHRYHPHVGEYYKAQFEQFKKSLEYFKDEIDHLYLIDSYWGFTNNDISQIPIPTTIIPKERDGHHWVQFKTALNYLTNEDRVLFLDSDVVIYKKGIVDDWFKRSESLNLLTAFDGSGGLEHVVRDRFPILKENNSNRMGTYYFVADNLVLNYMREYDMAPIHYPLHTGIPELEYRTVEGDWSDSFGLLTIKMLATPNFKAEKIHDERASIYLSDAGTILKDPTTYESCGYYHIRNGFHPMYILASKIDRIEDFKHAVSITPRRELLRLLAWFTYAQEGTLENRFLPDIMDLCGYVSVSKELWDTYYQEFKAYHKLQ